MISNVQYIISTMDEINTLTTDLYEALMDKEFEESNKKINDLIKTLRDVKKSINQDEL
jgi:protein-arginine kinase activator protein McsA